MPTVRTACPLDCPDACPPGDAVTDGRITAIDAVPAAEADNPLTDGWICRKVRRMTRRVHGPLRLTTPLARTGPKGSGAFEPISWDGALDRTAGAITAKGRFRRRAGDYNGDGHSDILWYTPGPGPVHLWSGRADRHAAERDRPVRHGWWRQRSPRPACSSRQ